MVNIFNINISCILQVYSWFIFLTFRLYQHCNCLSFQQGLWDGKVAHSIWRLTRFFSLAGYIHPIIYIYMLNKLLTSTKKYAKEKENTLFLNQETLLRLSYLLNIANIHILTVQGFCTTS